MPERTSSSHTDASETRSFRVDSMPRITILPYELVIVIPDKDHPHWSIGFIEDGNEKPTAELGTIIDKEQVDVFRLRLDQEAVRMGKDQTKISALGAELRNRLHFLRLAGCPNIDQSISEDYLKDMQSTK